MAELTPAQVFKPGQDGINDLGLAKCFICGKTIRCVDNPDSGDLAIPRGSDPEFIRLIIQRKHNNVVLDPMTNIFFCSDHYSCYTKILAFIEQLKSDYKTRKDLEFAANIRSLVKAMRCSMDTILDGD
jgi:hypothetical protein